MSIVLGYARSIEADDRLAELRGRVAWCRRWWRRDILILALRVAYPRWMSATELTRLCATIRPEIRNDLRHRGAQRARTARSLGRLHSWRTVDRIGRPGRPLAGRGPGGVLLLDRTVGYRYRLRHEAGWLL